MFSISMLSLNCYFFRAESPITISDNLGADIAVNGVENQASGDSQPNGDASSSSEQSSNDSPKEAVVKGQGFFLLLSYSCIYNMLPTHFFPFFCLKLFKCEVILISRSSFSEFFASSF